MTFEEKLAAKGKKMDETKARLDAAINARKLEAQANREQLAADIAALEARIDKRLDAMNAEVEERADKRADKLDAALDKQAERTGAAIDRAKEKHEKAKDAFTLDKATAESIANEASGVDLIQRGTAEQVADVKEKCDSLKLRTQTRLDDAKAKVAAHKEAIDRAEQEEWILDLLDYANECYEAAYAWALEGEYTLMEAAYEINDYTERFCK